MEPPPARGSHIYKYGHVTGDRLGWLKSTLFEHTVCAPNAPELNDPQEAHPVIQSVSVVDWAKFADRRHAVLLDEPLQGFKDKFSKLIEPDWNNERLRRRTMDTLHHVFESFRQYSMTKRCDNLSMWTKYADNHRGFCLKFRNAGWFAQAREIVYGDAPPLDINDHLKWFWFYFKRAEWSNEEELRVMLPIACVNEPVRPFNPHYLTRVILGKDMDPAVAAQIREWVKHRFPRHLPVVCAAYDRYNGCLTLNGF